MIIALIFVLTAWVTYHIVNMLIPEPNFAKSFTSFTMFINIVTFTILRGFSIKSIKTTAIAASAFCILLLFLITGWEVKTEYQEAAAQREFPIILENSKVFVVISTGKEDYSTYQCLISDGELTILTNVHKYFDANSTETTPVVFENVKKAKLKPLSSNEVETYFHEEYKLSEPYSIEYFNEIK